MVDSDDSEGKHLITVRETRKDFTAVLKGHAVFGHGSTRKEAIGDCVLNAHRLLGVAVHIYYSGAPDPWRAAAKRDPIVPDIQLAHDVIAAHAAVECEYEADEGVYQPGPVSRAGRNDSHAEIPSVRDVQGSHLNGG